MNVNQPVHIITVYREHSTSHAKEVQLLTIYCREGRFQSDRRVRMRERRAGDELLVHMDLTGCLHKRWWRQMSNEKKKARGLQRTGTKVVPLL